MARQLGSSLGVALLVVVLGSNLSDSGFDRVWMLALASAVLTGITGLVLPRSERAYAVAAYTTPSTTTTAESASDQRRLKAGASL